MRCMLFRNQKRYTQCNFTNLAAREERVTMRTVFFLLACTFSSLLAAQETREICPQPTPPGWVVVSKRLCADCCGPGMAEMLTIRRINSDSERAHRNDEGKEKPAKTDPGLTRVEVCPQEVPPGWVVVSTRLCADCCGSGMAQKLTIERVGGDSERTHRDDDEHKERHREIDPTLKRTEMCPQATPPGWVIISGRPCASCCGTTEISRMLAIRRIDDEPKGTRIEMCPQETPPGWAVVGTRPCAGCCGTTEIDQMVTIEKL